MQSEKWRIRLQKHMADCGVCSRRAAEELIKRGKVKINGRSALIGAKVDPRLDRVTVNGKLIESRGEKHYIMLHKPRGYITTVKDELGRKSVMDLLPRHLGRVYPVGRLDRNSEGLLLITNDGHFMESLTHPSRHVSKTYRVTVKGKITKEQLSELSSGMVIEGYKTAPAEVAVVSAGEDRTVLKIVLREGRNRQIRKMCEQLNLPVSRLKRISIGDLKLGALPVGKWRALTAGEVKSLLYTAGVKPTIHKR